MYTDPSGNSIDSLGCIPMVFSEGNGLKNMTSAQLISLCRGFFSPQYWAQKHSFDCNALNSREWTKPQTVGALFEDYICERGPERVVFYSNDNLTKQLAYSILLDRIRKEFYHGETNYPKEQKFNHLEFFLAFADAYAANLINSPDLPVTHFLGSFNYTVAKKDTGGIQITIDNRSDLASGTHFPGHFPPEGEGEFPLTLEKVIRERPELAFVPAWYVIDRYRDNEGRGIVAALQPLSRSQTLGGMGGGTMRQVFTWTEADISCEIQNLPWPAYLPLLHIH
jgi:hypothetical protein